MILRPYAAAFGLVLPLANACGRAERARAPSSPNSSHATPPVEGSEVATGAEPTKFQRRRLLGHYSTFDGASGFILDRTGADVRARLDGTSNVKILTARGGPHQTREYRSADGQIWLRLDQYGEVLLFQGPSQSEGVEVIRDADAEPLE
jgi:hypothetical protein